MLSKHIRVKRAMLKKVSIVPVSMVNDEERKRLRKLLAGYRGAISDIARRVEPPVHRTTITLWFDGRVQSARLDIQIPRCIDDFLKFKKAEQERLMAEMGLVKRTRRRTA